MKLLRKLIIRVLILVVFAGSIIGGVSVLKSYNATRDLTLSKVENQLLLKTALIEEKIESTIRLIEIFGYDTEVIRALTSNKKDSSIIDSFTKTVNNNSDLITLISLIDRNGIVLLSDDLNKIEGIDLSERQYLKDAIASKKTSVSEIIVSKADGSYSVAICMPVYNNNVYVGSIVSTVKFDMIAKLVDDIKVGENGYAYIIDIKGDDAGLVVDHPDDAMINKNLYDLGVPELADLADDMQVNKTGDSYYVYKGVEKFVSYSQIGSNWTLAITANVDEITATSNEILKITILVIVIVILLSLILGYFTVNKLVIKPIRNLQISMKNAGEGDLTQKVNIKTKDELEILGQSYNQMIENQKNIILDISHVSQDMSAAAEELTASAEEVNESAEDVSSNIQDMMHNIMTENDAMMEVQSQINMMNTSTEQSNQLITDSKKACVRSLEVAQEGRSGVTTSVSSIKNISEATQEVMSAFTELNEHAKEVTGISAIIGAIADQINLLALNASIEAARAGEAGRGFTVVAEEVRKLAEQTSQESYNISNVLNTIILLIQEVNKSVERAKNHVDSGSTTINQLDGKFLDIIDSFDALNAYIDTLSEISDGQVNIADEIKAAIDSVSDVNQNNTSRAQEISATAEEQAAITENLSRASEETSNMADQLNRMIDKFKL
ncbi:MAG: methyl-accepting chemotaxis protein [Clostridia bacterium]|nr:methyl-accepting chemotaxis protein [Clostridia bacterium]